MKERIIKLLKKADGFIVDNGAVLTSYKMDDKYLTFKEVDDDGNIYDYNFFISDLDDATYENGSFHLVEMNGEKIKVDFLKFEHLN